MGEKEIEVAVDGLVATLTLERPEVRNALTASLLDSLVAELQTLRAGKVVRCLVLCGAGGNFCVGMDLRVMAESTPAENQRLIGAGGPLRRAIAAIEAFPFPVIARLDEYAVGAGCELAMSCDLRIGTPATRMGMPPSRLGIVYPPEGLGRFSNLLGPQVTKKLFLTAKYYQGEELEKMGMLDFICGPEELEGFCSLLADEIASLAPLSLQGHKKLLNSISRSALSNEAMGESLGLIEKAMASDDAREGIAAFLEKRKPTFEGK
jgi:enoyl-CoA hydratase/carnithine racemase